MPTPAGVGETFSYQEARRAGWSKRGLYASRDSGELETLGRGLYRRADAPLADVDLIEIAHRAPRATICLVSALARHGLTDQNPPSIEVALPRTARQPHTVAPVTWHRFAVETFDVGRDLLSVGGEQIGLYDPVRTLVDAFRLRHREGDDVAYEALRRWVRRRSSRPADLIAIARFFPSSERAIREALRVLL